MVNALRYRTCNKVHIGETGRRKGDRFREHYAAHHGLNVGDMLVSVIRSGFGSATERCSFEARMIFRRQTLVPAGLNVDFDLI